jgi:hypothetical protein
MSFMTPFDRSAFLGQVRLVPHPGAYLSQAITDPVILAKVNLAEAYGDAIIAISKVVQVTPEAMAASAETARMTFDSLLKNPTFLPYVMKVLVLSAVIVKDNIRALGMTPQQLANVLLGAEQSVKKLVPEAELPAKLTATQDEIVSRAPANIKEEVRKRLDSSGIKPENLVPHIPEGATREPVTQAVQAAAPGMSELEKAALIGVPIVLLAAVGFIAR